MKKYTLLFLVCIFIITAFLYLNWPSSYKKALSDDVLNFTKYTYDSILYDNKKLGNFEYDLKKYGYISRKSKQDLIDDIWKLTNNYYFEFGNRVYITRVEINSKKVTLFVSNAYPEADTKVDDILDKLTKSNMNILEKQKNIVKYLASNFTYDSANINKNNINKAFETRKALCEDYSGIYFRCMRRLNIPVRIVVNKNHAWNMTKINGNWYHTDITYISAVNDYKNFFNVSTQQILKTRTYDTENYPKSNSSLNK